MMKNDSNMNDFFFFTAARNILTTKPTKFVALNPRNKNLKTSSEYAHSMKLKKEIAG